MEVAFRPLFLSQVAREAIFSSLLHDQVRAVQEKEKKEECENRLVLCLRQHTIRNKVANRSHNRTAFFSGPGCVHGLAQILFVRHYNMLASLPGVLSAELGSNVRARLDWSFSKIKNQWPCQGCIWEEFFLPYSLLSSKNCAMHSQTLMPRQSAVVPDLKGWPRGHRVVRRRLIWSAAVTSVETSSGSSQQDIDIVGRSVPPKYDPSKLKTFFSKRPVTVIKRAYEVICPLSNPSELCL